MNQKLRMEYVSKQVIEGRLLAVLDEDKSKVAIIASKQDLSLLLQGLGLLKKI